VRGRNSVCKLRLAVEGLAPNRETGYINTSCFGKPSEAAARVLSKGWLVAVAGRLVYDEWETAGGVKRHDYEVVANVEFLAAPHRDGLRAKRVRRRCRREAVGSARPRVARCHLLQVQTSHNEASLRASCRCAATSPVVNR
jgi:single-stranded DNA-binding protein